jgi:WD40 repeat protein
MRRAAWLVLLPTFAGCLVNRWSATPDGRLIALAAGNSVVLADGDWKKLAQWDSHNAPAIVEVSPDGKWIAFNTDKTDGLWLIERATDTRTQVAASEHGVYLHNAWSPDSSRLAYVIKDAKGAGEIGRLRVYNVLTGETVTLLDQSVPAYAWSPSGERLFAVRAHMQSGVDEPRFGTLVSCHDGKSDQLADIAGFAWVDAASDTEVWFVTAASKLTELPGDNDEKFRTVSLYRVSTEDSRVAKLADGVGWFDLSPDRTHALAWALEEREAGDPLLRLEILDRSGKIVRTLKSAAEYEKRPSVVPMWIGNDRVLVPTGEGDATKFEVVPLRDGESRDVTADWKGWKK